LLSELIIVIISQYNDNNGRAERFIRQWDNWKWKERKE